MSWYRDYKEQWKEIIETVAAEEHRTTQMVEKDTIQSMILSGISQRDLPFVFKGGTSLSKTLSYYVRKRLGREKIINMVL